MDTISTSTFVAMQVRKRNGTLEPADVNKIVRAVARCCDGLPAVDPLRVATKTISGLYDGATTQELDRLSIQTAAMLIAEEPAYSLLAARLLATYIDKEVESQEIHSFSQSVAAGYRAGLISEDLAAFVLANSRKLNDAIDPSRNDRFEYFGLRTVYERYLLRHPHTRSVLETPNTFSCGSRAALRSPRPRRWLTTISFRPSIIFRVRQRSLTRGRHTLSFPRASCSILQPTISKPFTALIATSRSSRNSRAASV